MTLCKIRDGSFSLLLGIERKKSGASRQIISEFHKCSNYQQPFNHTYDQQPHMILLVIKNLQQLHQLRPVKLNYPTKSQGNILQYQLPYDFQDSGVL